jgi:excinuclease ABC subunit A
MTTAQKQIQVRGARVHNLKNVDIEVPKKSFVVFTGPSGSGKSSLAFDTLFAEGQRRYVESLSVYARQFLGQMDKPDVDLIDGLSPTVSIEQKSGAMNPRSTVGTITEIYDHLRVLYARIGEQHCHSCGRLVGSADTDEIVRSVLELETGTKFQILGPLVRNRKGEFRDLFEQLRAAGYTRARIDGEVKRLEDVDKLRKTYKHDIDVVIDRIVTKEDIDARVRKAVDRAFDVADEQLVIVFDSGPHEGTERYFSRKRYCQHCDLSFPELTQQSFSFNSPLGMCPSCKGLGTEYRMDEERVIPDPERSLKKGAIEFFRGQNNRKERLFVRVLEAFCRKNDIPYTEPWESLTDEQQDMVLHGVDEVQSLMLKGRKRAMKRAFEGILQWLLEHYENIESETKRDSLGEYLSDAPCSLCNGTRLRPESRAVKVGDAGLDEVSTWDVQEAHDFFAALELSGERATIGAELVKEVVDRFYFLLEVGLGYLTLMRPGPSLSGGEAQRIRLASQLGANLSGVLYVLDEPSIGLHQRDNIRLIRTLTRLRDSGNHVLVVEHDRETMESADWVVDFGPGAGANGGEIVFAGDPNELVKSDGNITGDYLAGRREIEVPEERREGSGHSLVIRGARENNLRRIDAEIPLETFTCVTGVSGAGKSTLINDILYPVLMKHVYDSDRRIGVHAGVDGLEYVDKIVQIDQKPIGRTPRSNPATYTKVFDDIRKLFSQMPESRVYGYKPGRFSFNVKGGRCEACSGAGVEKIEMQFLADVYVQCSLCKGKRFNDATLRVKYREKSIADVLDMQIAEAAEFFDAHPRISRILTTLDDVGLGYVKLGQPSPTLSGGEAQRIKLARELSKVATGDTVYLLDEPSTGLHFDDIRKLLNVVHRLVDGGNTVVIIEHNLDIIKVADHVIDLGPEGGSAGGEIVAAGTPEEIASNSLSYTGKYLKEELQR